MHALRTDNLFKQLDERSLTQEEQGIIDQRVGAWHTLFGGHCQAHETLALHTCILSSQVQLQRKLYAEFERRERDRKVVPGWHWLLLLQKSNCSWAPPLFVGLCSGARVHRGIGFEVLYHGRRLCALTLYMHMLCCAGAGAAGCLP